MSATAASVNLAAPGQALKDAMIAHALEEMPRESCGVIVDGEYVRCKNVHANPESGFRLDSVQWARLWASGGVQAIVHSHPNGVQYPNSHDMREQIDFGIPYGIVPCREDKTNGTRGAGKVFFFGDGVPRAPLVGRGFRHGVTDCYGLIRDWYLIERGITLPEVPRDWGWWNEKRGPGLDLYLDTYSAAGFKSAGRRASLEVGDIVLIQSPDSPVVNHAGIYVGGGINDFLHHTCVVPYDPKKLSVVEPVSKNGQFVRDVIRYQGGAA